MEPPKQPSWLKITKNTTIFFVGIPQPAGTGQDEICPVKTSIPNTLPKTNIAPENGWLVQMNFLLGFGLILGALNLLVSGSV